MRADLADLIVHLARAAQSSARTDLTAAQWTALRYFARANRFSRTPSAFSEFHATTRGTASQTVKSLVEIGLLARAAHEGDGRSTLIEVTEAGRAMLQNDPMEGLRSALARLPQADQETLATILDRARADLARLRDVPVFGTCADCSHCDRARDPAFCHCTGISLTLPDMAALCVDFSPKPART
ncbi:MAG: MarR family winged helix-turn-helix transcriptional regulator [Roseinatronobacter sp.]